MDVSALSVAEHAPAKINLALHVTGRRTDGYHLLETLAVFTQIGDRVTVSPAAEDSFNVSGPFGAHVPPDAENLVLRARDALHQSAFQHESARAKPPISPHAGEKPGPSTKLRTERGNVERRLANGPVAIRLEKNLPVASGIGGGSSDAAATLKGLARLWNLGWTPEQLTEIGRRLGADIPMCLHAKPLVASGIGEVIDPLPTFPAMPLVLVNPGIAVPTPDVFRKLASRENPGLPSLLLFNCSSDVSRWLAATRNDLQIPAVSISPAIAEALDALAFAGAGFARMSGSGATCFGLFQTPGAASRAAAAIRQSRPDWFVAATSTMV